MDKEKLLRIKKELQGDKDFFIEQEIINEKLEKIKEINKEDIRKLKNIIIAIMKRKQRDGVGLEFHWDGTKLGIKREDEDEFKYVDLKGKDGYSGPQGPPGPPGPKGDKGDPGTGIGDMTKSVYDKNDDGIVDSSEKIEGIENSDIQSAITLKHDGAAQDIEIASKETPEGALQKIQNHNENDVHVQPQLPSVHGNERHSPNFMTSDDLDNKINIHIQNDVHTQPQPPAIHTHNHNDLDEIGTNTHAIIDAHLADNITNRRHLTDAQNDAFDNAPSPSATNRVILVNDLDSGYAESEDISSTSSTTYQDKLIYDFTPKSSGNYLVMWSAEMTGVSLNRNASVRLLMGAGTISEVGFRTNDFHVADGGYSNFGGFKVVNLTETTTFKIQYRVVGTAFNVSIRRARLFIKRII